MADQPEQPTPKPEEKLQSAEISGNENRNKELASLGRAALFESFPVIKHFYKLCRFFKSGGIQMEKEGLTLLAILVLIIAGIASVGTYELVEIFGKESKPANNLTAANNTNSPVTQANQSSNVSVKNNSDNLTASGTNPTLNNQTGTNNQISDPKFYAGVQGQMIFPANIGTLNINNPVYSNAPDTELRTWVTQVNETATFASNGILLTTKQLSQLTDILKKLDERTEDVQELPDGRTSLGGIVVGQPHIFAADLTAASQSIANHNFNLALKQSQKAIEDFETDPSNYLDEKISITPESKADAYKLASFSAGVIGSNELAYSFAEKSVDLSANATNKFVLILALGQRAFNKVSAGDYSNSFASYSELITNYEGIETNAIVSKSISTLDVARIYANAASVALLLGKTNEESEYREKSNELFSRANAGNK